MAKFVIKCPHCGTINQVSNSLFARKIHSCGNCHKDIDVKAMRMTSRICPRCGDTFIYDQAKGKNATCPSCGQTVDAFHATKYVTLNCPQCACPVEVDESTKFHSCPICGKTLDVQQEQLKAKLVNSGSVSVIQYEGDNSTFVWKHPIEDFNMGSQLIVHESQEAIFFMNGQALDLFGPGRYSLETENLPILKQIYKVPTGAQTPFHAEVYFINKTVSMAMKWGTDSRVRFVDPSSGVPLDIGASGEMNMCVSDSRKLLLKLVGTTGGLQNKDVLSGGSHIDVNGEFGSRRSIPNQAHRTLQSFFRAPLMTEIKSYLALTIKQQHLDIMEIDEHLGILSDALRDRIAPKFEEYGLTIPQFYITYVSLPEDDENFKKLRQMRAAAYIDVRDEMIKTNVAEAAQRRKTLEAQTEAQLAAIKAQGAAEVTRQQGLAEADVMRAKGYTHKDELQAEVQKAYATGLGQLGSSGGGNGGLVSDFVSMGAGIKMAGSLFEQMDFGFGQKKDHVETPAQNPNAWVCDSCGETGNTGKFCKNCGKPKAEAWDCSCGHKGNRGKFCEECGAARLVVWDCACGQKGNTGKCCPECGSRRPG